MGMGILIVDDDPILCEVIFHYLSRKNYDINIENNGNNVINKIMEIEPDLILLDIFMPGRTGYDILEEMKAKKIEIPVIIITGASQVNDILKAIKLGAWDYLRKPIMNIDEIEYKIQCTLEKYHIIKKNDSYRKSLEEAIKERDRLDNESEITINILRHRLETEIRNHIQTEIELNNLKQTFYQPQSHSVTRSLETTNLAISIVMLDSACEVIELNQYAMELLEINSNFKSDFINLCIYPEDRERFKQWFTHIFSKEHSDISIFYIEKKHSKQVISMICKADIVHGNQSESFIRLFMLELPPLLKKAIYPSDEFFEKYGLTEREKEILVLLIEGKKNKEIESELFISHNTLKTHISNIFRKLEIKERDEIYHKIIEHQQKSYNLNYYLISVIKYIYGISDHFIP